MLFYHLFALNSVFFYVGPDTDVFTLNTLLDEETEIMYVEPLTAFLNRKLITNSVVKYGERFDQLFECPPKEKHCAQTLQIENVTSYANILQKYLHHSSLCPIPNNSLMNLIIHNTSISKEKIMISFTSKNIARVLTIYIKRIQDMDPNVLYGKKITTFSRLGVGINGRPGKIFVCRNIDHNLRIITQIAKNPCLFSKKCNLTYSYKNPTCEVGSGETNNNQISYSIQTGRKHNWCDLKLNIIS